MRREIVLAIYHGFGFPAIWRIRRRKQGQRIMQYSSRRHYIRSKRNFPTPIYLI